MTHWLVSYLIFLQSDIDQHLICSSSPMLHQYCLIPPMCCHQLPLSPHCQVELYTLGEGEGEEEEVGGAGGSVRNKFLLSAAAHATAATPELGAATHHTQPHFDPDTHSRLVALLEAAGQYHMCVCYPTK